MIERGDERVRQPKRSARPSRAMAVLALGLVAACGGGDGGGGGTPTSPPVTVTESFTGSTTTLASGGCTAGSHFFQVATGGSVEVTLVASGDAAGLRVQVCADAIDNNDCTINLQSIAPGATVSGSRRGSQNQNLSFRRLGCTGGGPLVVGSVTYTATVTYQRP